MSHPIHKCLGCGGQIEPEQAEVQVPSRGRRPPRYRHEDDADCSRALQGPLAALGSMPRYPRRTGRHRASHENKVRRNPA